jgi:hypothetical protein
VEPRRSLGWPILLGILLIGSILALGVGWVLVSIAAALSSENAAFGEGDRPLAAAEQLHRQRDA